MSIPPLVCSTPPPPDQCEDDKDPEDFDLQYNFSQEDDEDESNDYDYGNFSSFSHFQSSTSTSKKKEATVIEIVSKSENIETIDIESEKSNIETSIETNTEAENEFKCDEEINVEDLNLKVDEESIEGCNIEDSQGKENNTVEIFNDDSVKDIPIISSDIDKENVDSYVLTSTSNAADIKIAHDDEILKTSTNKIVKEELSKSELTSETKTVVLSCDVEKNETSDLVENSFKTLETTEDDGFGDFEDFQLKSTENQQAPAAVVNSCENPWESKEFSNSEFGDFVANFDDNINQVDNSVTLLTEQQHSADHDDDFGDFDDFKSSVVENVTKKSTLDESVSCQQGPVLNWQLSDNEHQIMESINKVLSSIFEHEIMAPVCEFEGKLETQLSVTWGHLMETDVRQPYIVNWNNSFGQKTLLKSLCIDSRNILFAPKWGSCMPKYATNLSTAPLQPQKQIASMNVTQNENMTSDKSLNKSSNWQDPFSSHGQESCNTENQSPAIQAGPTDLDVFEATLSSKSEKIYSTTLNVQPIRQISLPDTHIFTPTDSETPRSKTIHYNTTVLLPQPVIEKNQLENSTTKDTVLTSEKDDEYWEFQDFKSTSKDNALPLDTASQQISSDGDNLSTSCNNTLAKTNITYQKQVLQPIKVDLTMPSLNWPDPGEVKETFDDFSDFMSKSLWRGERMPTTHDTVPQVENVLKHMEAGKVNDASSKSEYCKEKVENGDKCNGIGDVDDEFDTFKSALPTKNNTSNFILSSWNQESNSKALVNVSNISQETSSNSIADFNVELPKSTFDSMSFAKVTKTNEALTQSLDYSLDTTEIISNTLPIESQLQNNLLQPIQANSSVTQCQQKTGQILQPLSLESFSQINWPSPGIDLQDLSRFNPVETLQSLKSDLSVNSKVSSPIHSQKSMVNNQLSDDDVWGEFVSTKPKQQPLPKKSPSFVDDDEWTDFVSSPSVKPQNGLNTISLNVHTNSNVQKSNQNKFTTLKNNQAPLDIPTLNYITPKTSNHKDYNNRHFQNL